MAGLVDAFTGDFKATKKVAEVLFAPLDADGKIDYSFGKPKVLQYWPETLSESGGANWQAKEIPGSNRPLYQWVSGGERQFSFTAVFSRDMDGEIGDEIEEDKYNVDIDAAIAWLSMLKSNDYDTNNRAVAPPTLWLMFMGTKLGYHDESMNLKNYESESGVYCILNQADPERADWFPSGRPKFATVALTLSETIQIGSNVYPYGRKTMLNMSQKYTRTQAGGH